MQMGKRYAAIVMVLGLGVAALSAGCGGSPSESQAGVQNPDDPGTEPVADGDEEQRKLREDYDYCPLPSNPDVRFTVMPVSWENITHMQGFGSHVGHHPEGVTKHYFYNRGSVPVVAPADGLVKRVTKNTPDGSIDDYSLLLCFSAEIRGEFGHLASVNVAEGAPFKAGDVIATTQPVPAWEEMRAIDFYVYKTGQDNGFPDTWPQGFQESVCFAEYLEEGLKADFYQRWEHALAGQESWKVYDMCEPEPCRTLNTAQDYTLSGVWGIKSGAAGSPYGSLLVFVDCNDDTITAARGFPAGQDWWEVIGGAGPYYTPADDTDVGNGERCLFSPYQVSGMRYKFLSATELQVEFGGVPPADRNCPASFTSEARIYDRNYVDIHN